MPTGEVAFLFSDIEGSTVRWDRSPAAMQLAVRRHDALMHAVIVAHHGRVFKTIGDAFCAVFWRIEDGIEAALEAQRALAAEDFIAVDGIRVRIALHVGSSDERDGDYFGPTLNRVARLLAIGHGGQVLLSAAATAAAGDRLPPAATIRDHGEHRLKDLTAPERVYQLVVPDLAAEFPALRSLSVLNNNLPLQLTSFVGRDRDVADIKGLLESSRLVTLFGAGGVGKTRCALQVGAELLDDFGDGVWFADLAPLGDPALVANAIASAFELQESPNHPMLDTLSNQLKGKQLLLILDNCEHLITEVARAAVTLLQACPKVKLLATSREALKIGGEIVHRMPSLAVPESFKELAAETALAYGAVALFDGRARAVNPNFVLTDENASIVADICRRLDGIPLAIELAAARAKVLAPRQLAQRLDERFRILTGGYRTALPRQQTMRALIDWSYDLLSEPEQTLFRYVSIFAGGFGLEAATAVCASETIEEFEVLDRLASLVDKSLVVADSGENEVRYRLLESMRQYAREKLGAGGETGALAARHAAAYAELAEQLEREYETLAYRPWLARTERELENVRAALTWSFGPGGDVLTGQRLATTLGRVLVAFAAPEARRWVTTARTHIDDSTPPPLAARLELAEAHLASVLNQYRAALSAAERAGALFKHLDDERGSADAKRFAGRSLIYLDRVADGEAALRESLVIHRALGSRRVGGTLRDLAAARALAGDVVGARALFAEALATFKESADEANVAITAGTLAEAEFRGGDAESALRVAEDGLAAARALNRPRMLAWMLGNIAALLVALGRYEPARERGREALRLACELQVEVDVAFTLQHLAATAALRPHPEAESAGELQRAALLAGFVDGRLAALEVVREYTEQQEYDRMSTALQAALGNAAVASLMADGRHWTEDRAAAEALQI